MLFNIILYIDRRKGNNIHRSRTKWPNPTDTPLTTSIDKETTPSCDEQSGESNGRLAIPGAQARKHLGRKRKAKDCQADSGLQAYMAQQSKQLQDMYEAE